MKSQYHEKLAARGRSLDGRPIWRIVWSPEQFERRRGKFSDFYGKIFLREREEVRTVPKYWYLLGPRWVLERLTFLPPNASIHRELISQSTSLDIHAPVTNGTYEPIYVFQDAEGNPLPVTEWAVDAILYTAEFGERKKVTEAGMREEYDRGIEADAKYFEAIIENEGRSPLFAFENSVFMDSTKTFIERVKPDEI